MGVQTWMFDAGSSNAGVRIWASAPGYLPLGYDSRWVHLKTPTAAVHIWEWESWCPILEVRFQEFEPGSPSLGVQS